MSAKMSFKVNSPTSVDVLIQSDKPVTSFQAFIKVPSPYKCTNIAIDADFKAKDGGMDLESTNNYLNEAVIVEASATGVDCSQPTRVAQLTLELTGLPQLGFDEVHSAVNNSLIDKSCTFQN